MINTTNLFLDDFNKINYFFYKNDTINLVDVDSRVERKRKAERLRKLRLQKLEVQKNIFETIVRDQAKVKNIIFIGLIKIERSYR